MKIVLASSSPYRKQLLKKLISDFECSSPNIDESHNTNESFIELAKRLAIEKAKAVAANYPNALIIGSDQVACLMPTHQTERSAETQQLCKPGNAENMLQQLKLCQGKTVFFHTSLCLYNSQNNSLQASVETYETTFRHLNDRQLKSYISKEPAFDCAGGFKMEGLGIALFEKIQGDDPNILVGLPLIKLIDMLNNEGVNIL